MTLVESHPLRQPLAEPRWQSGRTSYLVVAQLVVLVIVTLVWALPSLSGKSVWPWGVYVSAALTVGILVTLMCIGGIRTVAHHTFTQCLRTKVAAVFIVLLAAALAILPATMTGDGTLAGQIRTLLSYGTSFALGELCVLTVILTCMLISAEVRDKQIFITASKPIARWQYVLGRWLGVVWLDTLLLALAFVGVYALAYWMRTGSELSGDDRRNVETEIFVARDQVRPDAVKVDDRVKDRIRRLQEQGQYEKAVQAAMDKGGLNEAGAVGSLVAELGKQELQKISSADPGAQLFWTFSGIHTTGTEIRGQGVAANVPDLSRGLLRVEASKTLVGHVLTGTPVRINGVDAWAVSVGADFFVVQFDGDVMNRREIADLRRGQQAEIVIDPIVQITYRPELSTSTPDRLLPGIWVAVNPATGEQCIARRKDPIDRPSTITMTARCVTPDANGRMAVQFINGSTSNVRIAPENISVFFPAGSFEWNFFRGFLLMLLQLMFLAAIGTFFGSMMSFPVATLACITVMCFAMGGDFLNDSVALPAAGEAPDFSKMVGHYVVKAMSVPLPDFASTWSSDRLVEGLNISWSSLSQTAVLTIAVRSLLFLAAACLLFSRRELARVQV